MTGAIVRTVGGDIDPADLGPCDAHEHLFLTTPLQPGEDFLDVERSVAEARTVAEAGARAIVDWTPIGLGRDPAGLRAVAERAGLDHLDLNIAYPVGPKVAKYGCNLANTSWCRGGAATGRADLRAKDARASVRRAAKRLHVKVFARDPGNPARAVDWEEIKVEPRP